MLANDGRIYRVKLSLGRHSPTPGIIVRNASNDEQLQGLKAAYVNVKVKSERERKLLRTGAGHVHMRRTNQEKARYQQPH